MQQDIKEALDRAISKNPKLKSTIIPTSTPGGKKSEADCDLQTASFLYMYAIRSRI